jgi:hypothetical protein
MTRNTQILYHSIYYSLSLEYGSSVIFHMYEMSKITIGDQSQWHVNVGGKMTINYSMSHKQLTQTKMLISVFKI